MSGHETRLEMAWRHLAEAELRLLRHEIRIIRMELRGQSRLLPQARELREQMRDFLRHCQEDFGRELAKLQGEGEGSGGALPAG